MNILLNYLSPFLMALIPLLYAMTVHEFSHAYVAYKLGDNTAKDAGRLTLNPLAHISWLGIFVLFITRLIGWAKPVPINYNLIYSRKGKAGIIYVALAGVTANIISAVIFSFIYNNIGSILSDNTPIYILNNIYSLLGAFILINVALCIFNLLPILPLDGGVVVEVLLPVSLRDSYSRLAPYGMFIIIIFLILPGTSNILFRTILNITRFIVNIF